MTVNEFLDAMKNAKDSLDRFHIINKMKEAERATVFLGLSDSQKVEIMDQLGDKGKVLLYNAVDVTDRKNFLKLLSDEAKDDFIEDIRKQAVADFWTEEKN